MKTLFALVALTVMTGNAYAAEKSLIQLATATAGNNKVKKPKNFITSKRVDEAFQRSKSIQSAKAVRDDKKAI